MKKSSWFSFKILLIWAALLVALLILRPSTKSFLFWVLVIPAFIVGGWQMIISHLENKGSIDDWSAWEKRMEMLAVTKDVDDDGHLYEWFDPPEWEEIFEALETMPKGARSLRKAINSVDPDFINESA